MVKLGNFLFRNRNGIFPLFYLMLFIPSWEVFTNPVTAMIIGFSVTLVGQLVRVITIGLVYIIRGGKDRRVYAEDLVTTGIFAHCRNPLYVGNILILVGLGIASNSFLFMAVFTPVFLFFWQAIVLAEENYYEINLASSMMSIAVVSIAGSSTSMELEKHCAACTSSGKE